MRGKLRDKRPDSRRDNIKRELVERRRTAKRENRTMTMLRLNQQFDLEDEDQLDGDENMLLENNKN